MTENKENTDPVHGVVQVPGGEIQYFTKSLHKHNPYIHQSSNHEENEREYRVIECNGRRVLIATRDIERALEIECRVTGIKLLCIFDFIINLLVGFTYYIPVLYCIIVSFISLYGFIAAARYNKRGLILYLIYQYLQTTIKLAILSFYCVIYINHQILINLNKNNYNIASPTLMTIWFYSFVTFGQIYIVVFIQKFYYLLPSNTLYPIRRVFPIHQALPIPV